MKPLNQSYQMLVFYRIFPPDDPKNRWIQFQSILFSILSFTILSIDLAASIAFAVKFSAYDLANTLCASYQIVGCVSAIYTIIVAHLLRDDFKKVFSAFQMFYDLSKLFK